jgi:hypothetical protein
MKIKIVNKNVGYFVGFGGLTKKQELEIKKIIKKNGTYKIEGISGLIGY